MAYFVNFLKGLSTPVRYGGYGYFLSAVTYTSFNCYKNSQNMLNDYRNKDIDTKTKKIFSEKNINSEFEACKYGAYYKFSDIFCSSIIWPFSVSSDIVPYFVLLINPTKTSKSSDKDN